VWLASCVGVFFFQQQRSAINFQSKDSRHITNNITSSSTSTIHALLLQLVGHMRTHKLVSLTPEKINDLQNATTNNEETIEKIIVAR
jgi:hypothetical protein